MPERAPTTLELTAEIQSQVISESNNPIKVRNAITELGFAHLAMEADQVSQAGREIWTGMHGRSLQENLGIVARIAGQVFYGPWNPLTREHQAALQQDQDSATQQRAGER